MKDKYEKWFNYLPYIWVLFLVTFITILTVLSGVWPPFVSVKTGSMSPHITVGDYVYTVDYDRYAPQRDKSNIVTRYEALQRENTKHTKFGKQGDVIIYYPNGDKDKTPVIHRAMFEVSKGENWVKKANESNFNTDNVTCENIPNCPSPHNGYITKGDSVSTFDQARGLSKPVKELWIKSKAMVRIPYFTYIYSGLAIFLTFSVGIYSTIYIGRLIKEKISEM